MIDFFDVNHWLGKRQNYLASRMYSSSEKKAGIKDIRRLLDDNDIKKAIITNKFALSYEWKDGNEKLLESGLSGQIKGVFYSFVIAPEAIFSYDFPRFLADAYKDGVRLFRVFPRSHLFYLNDYYMKKIYKVLSKAGFPLMLDLKQLDITGNKYFDIDVLERVLDENPDMPLILETTLKQCMFNRYYFPLLERFKNMYLEVSGLLLYDQIEHYVEKFGSERLVFGTGYPDLPVEINTGRMILADISETDKKKIASGNLERIIGGIKIG